MLETRYRAARALPLGAQTRTASAGSGVSVRPAGAEARFSLRARLGTRALSDEVDTGSSKESAAQQRLRDASRPNVVGRSSSAVPKLAGLALDAPINTVGTAGEVWLARLGPDEWLVGGSEADADLLQGRIHEALAGLPHSLVDVSHRNVGIDVSGRQAAAVLNAGCPLDLSESAFPPGSATRTLLGKSEIVLIRASAAPLYRVECWRSFSTYVHGLLNEAVFGVEGSAAH